MFFDVDEYEVFEKIVEGLKMLKESGFRGTHEKYYSEIAVRFISPSGEKYNFITALCYAKTGKSYAYQDGGLGEIIAAEAVSFSPDECCLINAADTESSKLKDELWGFWKPQLAFIQHIRSQLFRFPLHID
jgi:hypothetical protein